MIVHIFNSSIISGPETLVIPSLLKLGKAVHIVMILESRKSAQSSDEVIQYLSECGLPFDIVWSRSRFDRRCVRSLNQLLLKLKACIIHCHDVKASTLGIMARRGLSNARWFSTHHGVRARIGLKAKIYEHFYAKFVLPQFDKVLAVCRSDLELLIKRGLKNVALHQNGVDRKRLSPQDRKIASKKARERWDISSSQQSIVFGFVGRIAREKRIDRIFEVLAQLKNVDWILLIFGRGYLESELKKHALQLKIDDRVRWMGYQKNIAEDMAGLDVLLSMSDAEGLPINLIEAAWSETPVISTRVDGCMDLISKDDEGLLLDLELSHRQMADEIENFVVSPERLAQVASNYQKRIVNQFSGKSWRHRLLEIYDLV